MEKRLVEYTKLKGGFAFKFVSPGMRFVPDRICLFPGARIAFVELKQRRGRVHPGQKRILSRLARWGFPVFLVRDEASFNEYKRWVTAET